MRIAYITAGAAGMYCGSCLHDNTLAAALMKLGHDTVLIPTYTPTRTDEKNVSQTRVFFGGINVFLQQKVGLFRRTPWFLDRLLDLPPLLRWASRRAVKTEAWQLADLTISMLRGTDGRQRKEVEKLAHWLASHQRPQVVVLTAALLSGIVPELKRRLGVPVVGMLQGDDIFLESLPEPYRSQALDLVRGNCRHMDGFLTTSAYYRDFNADYLGIARERIDVVHPGLNLRGHGSFTPEQGYTPRERPLTIGYFARICPEKGLHVLADAFIRLRQAADTPYCHLRVSGWRGADQQEYLSKICDRITEAGLGMNFSCLDCPDLRSKVLFLSNIDLLCVPTTYREPKGLYVLEAWANSVPVVQPRHGSFPELIEKARGGWLVEPNDPADLANTLARVLRQPEELRAAGRRGQEMVHQYFNAARMAQETAEVLSKYVG